MEDTKKKTETAKAALSESSRDSDNNLFDPERLRLSQDFAAQAAVKKILTVIPVRKPDRQSFIRVRPDSVFRMNAAILELKEEREIYLVEPHLLMELSGDAVPTTLFTAINRQNTVFLWPIPLPDANGRQNPWHRSALAAAEEAMKGWVKIAANMNLGGYDVHAAVAKYPDPDWPTLGFAELLKIAFQDKFIGSLDHPVVQRLRGLK